MQGLVYTPGCWDLLHVGHLDFLRAARRLGDFLVVGVASDEVIIQDKGKSPIIPEGHRREMLHYLEPVGHAVIYRELAFLPHLEEFEPAIFAVGPWWYADNDRVKVAKRWTEAAECGVVYIEPSDRESSTYIRERCVWK